MKQTITVELTEQDVEKALKEYVLKHQNLIVASISMCTSTRGNYDRGDAVDYVKTVWCECA